VGNITGTKPRDILTPEMADRKGGSSLPRHKYLYHRNKVPGTRIKLLSQEMTYCHRNKVPGKRIEYLPNINKSIFFQRKKILVNIINLLSNSSINKGVTVQNFQIKVIL
jgi:hypothetical protein